MSQRVVAMPDTLPLDLFLLFLILIVAFAVVVTRNLMAMAALLAIYSLLMSLVWANMWAMDVAFTEAAVGAGISTILVIGALVTTGVREKARNQVHWPALIVVLITGTALMYGTIDMPLFGDPTAPIHSHVVPEYMAQDVGKVEGGPILTGKPHRLPPGAIFETGNLPPEHSHDEDGHHDAVHQSQTKPAHVNHGDFSHHAPNLVTPMLASYRGYDTMFETAVIFTAGISVILLLRASRKEEEEEADVNASGQGGGE